MTTPMFQQYHSLKAAQPDAILFFRMGDFYEMFFEDAEVASRELELTLTSRNRNDPEPIPMAGVPHHAAAGYIQRLVDRGYRVAIADQTQDPSEAKGLVRREIVRVVTPGVALDPSALEGRRANWLAAVARRGDLFGLAFLDASTGALRVAQVRGVERAAAELQRFAPREGLLAPEADDDGALRGALRDAVWSEAVAASWRRAAAVAELKDTLGVPDLARFGVDPEGPGVCAAGAAVRYARERLGGRLDNLHALRPYAPGGFMVVDETTLRNLELVRTLAGRRRKGSVLALLDRAGTSMGSRRIREWLSFPLVDAEAIAGRQGAVGALVDDPVARGGLREALRAVADIERIGARVAQQTAHARDLAGLSRSLQAAPEAVARVRSEPALAPHVPEDLCADVALDLETWLVDDPPQVLTEGGLIRRGAHPELDELTDLSLQGVGIIAALEAQEQEATGIASLKIRKNRVFGYFIEVTRANLHRVPERFLRKQTLSNCERYVTEELEELEARVMGADERRKQLEYDLFTALRERVGEASRRLLDLADRLATLDALAALAEVAVEHRWTRPEVEDSGIVHIEGGRHPVVEAALDDERFVPNDMWLDTAERSLVVITGPNMSGKSTVMRQVALIALLAQMGSFVPATRARIGLCDRIFTRVGASDDLSRGQSTFMVEMAETAAILHQATDRSLVILDEIGRGTSTYDGLAIAWAVAEDIVDRIGCRTLFATHYHELCELQATRSAVANQSVAVSETGEDVIFLRRLKEGGASRSYGIQCARIAGLPAHVVQRARRLLTRFEKHAPRNEREQLSLFGQAPDLFADALPEEQEPPPDPLRQALDALDPDAMTPRQALDALYTLHALLEG